jgi:hypothetical protein
VVRLHIIRDIAELAQEEVRAAEDTASLIAAFADDLNAALAPSSLADGLSPLREHRGRGAAIELLRLARMLPLGVVVDAAAKAATTAAAAATTAAPDAATAAAAASAMTAPAAAATAAAATAAAATAAAATAAATGLTTQSGTPRPTPTRPFLMCCFDEEAISLCVDGIDGLSATCGDKGRLLVPKQFHARLLSEARKFVRRVAVEKEWPPASVATVDTYLESVTPQVFFQSLRKSIGPQIKEAITKKQA